MTLYFLSRKKKVVYIGQTNNFNNRIKKHGDKEYDGIRTMECDEKTISYYENRWIALFKPEYNKYPGKLADEVTSFLCRIDKDLLREAKKYAYDNNEIGGLSGLIRRLLAKEIGYRDKE